METQDTEQNQIDFMSKKLFNMNEKLDQLVLLAHQLVVQNKGSTHNDISIMHYNKIVFKVMFQCRFMFTKSLTPPLGA